MPFSLRSLRQPRLPLICLGALLGATFLMTAPITADAQWVVPGFEQRGRHSQPSRREMRDDGAYGSRSSRSTYMPNRFGGGGTVYDQQGRTSGRMTPNPYTGGMTYTDQHGNTASYTPSRFGGGVITDSSGRMSRYTPNRFSQGGIVQDPYGFGQLRGRYQQNPYDNSGVYEDYENDSVTTFSSSPYGLGGSPW